MRFLRRWSHLAGIWLLLSCGGGSTDRPLAAAETDPLERRTPGGSADAPAERADPEPSPAAEPADRCGASARAHVERRGEPGLDLVEEHLAQTCREREWDDRMHACVRAAADDVGIVECQGAMRGRKSKVAVRSGRIASSGIPECDRFFNDYLSCMTEHLNPEQLAKMRESFDTAATGMRDMPEEARGQVAEGCEKQRQQVRASGVECDWSDP